MTANRGGARRGAGRPSVDGATGVERATITLTPDDREKLRQLGGSPWIRSQIRAAPPVAGGAPAVRKQ